MNPQAVAVAIPVVAIIMGIGFVMLTSYFDYRRRTEVFKLHHAERMAAIEKGIEVPPLPPEFFQGGARGVYSPAKGRRFGLVLLFVGCAVFAALGGFANLGKPSWLAGGSGALWGLVPAGVGIAYLISSFLEVREQKRGGSGQGGPPEGGRS